MTTLAANKMRDYEIGEQNELPVIAADIIYQGAAVGDNGSGYMRPLVAGDPFRGFAIEQADNSTGAAGDKRVKLWKKNKIVLTVVGASAVTDVGRAVYATDDDTFTFAPAAAATFIGSVVRWVTSTTCIVEFDATRSEDAVVTDTITLTTAEILALNTTPKALVPAPGAGKVVDLLSAVGFLDHGGTNYAANGNMLIQTTTTNTAQSDTVAEATFLFAAADAYVGFQVLSAERVIDVNEGLEVTVATGDPTTGDGTVTIKVSYRILNFS